VKLTTNIHLALKSILVELYLHSAVRLHGVTRATTDGRVSETCQTIQRHTPEDSRVNRIRTRRRGIRSSNSFFATASRPALGPTQPPIRWMSGPLPPTGKANEADHTTPASVEVRNVWSYIHALAHTDIYIYILVSRCLIKHRDNLHLSLPQYFLTSFQNFNY
jgi:hypothetical protein